MNFNNSDNLVNLLQDFPNDIKLEILGDMKMYQKGLKDPEFFINYYLGIQLNPFQKRVIQNTFKDGKSYFTNLFIAGNRSGKTVLIALLHLYFDFYKIGLQAGEGWDDFKYYSFNISPVSRQANNAMDYYVNIAEGKFSWVDNNGERHRNQSKIVGFIKSQNKNMGLVTNINNSHFLCMASGDDQGSKFQGLACGYMSYDECVQSYHLEKELGARFFSRLADYGQRFDLLTTPDELSPSQQYLYHLYLDAKEKNNQWNLVEGTFYENIFLPQEQRLNFIKTLKEQGKDKKEQWKQVLEGAFISTGEKMFDRAAIHRIWNKKTNPTPALDGHQYVVIVDWGVAERGDDTVVLVIDKTTRPYEIVNHLQVKGGDPSDLMSKVRIFCINYNNAALILDATSLGGTTFAKMLGDLHPIQFGKDSKDKDKGLTYLQIMLNYNRKFHYSDEGELIEENPNFGIIRSYTIPEMENQLALYNLKYDKKLKQDYVMCLVMFAWYINYKEEITKPKVLKLNWH